MFEKEVFDTKISSLGTEIEKEIIYPTLMFPPKCARASIRAERNKSKEKRKEIRAVLLSAGLSLVTERIRKEITINYSIFNELIAKYGLLTGEVKVKVSVNNKDEILACS